MGSSLTSQQSTPFIQIDPTEHCQLISQTQTYKLYQNHRGEQYEKYLINKFLQQNKFVQNKSSYPKKYVQNRPTFQENYQYRLTHRAKYFVQLLYASPLQTAFSCNFGQKKGDYQVVTQRIKHRLNQMYNLSFTNAITILNISLRGFKNLFNYNGTLWIKDSMIGVNQNDQVRVWLNSNFSVNSIEPLPISLMNLCVEAQQDLIVNNLIDMISSKTYPSNEWKELMKLRMEMMANSRVVQEGMNANTYYRQDVNSSNGHHNSTGNNNSNLLMTNINKNSKISELEQSNRMTFDLALQMVNAVLIRFGMQQIRDNNRVHDLFSQGNNQIMIRQLTENNSQNMVGQNAVAANPNMINHPNLTNKSIVPTSNNIAPNNIAPQNIASYNNSKPNNEYPSRMKQIKSHIGIQHHLINQQMNGKQMYELQSNPNYNSNKNLHNSLPFERNSQLNQINQINQKSNKLQNVHAPITHQLPHTHTMNHQARQNNNQFSPYIQSNQLNQLNKVRSFNNPFIDSGPKHLNSHIHNEIKFITEKQVKQVLIEKKKAINPFDQVLNTKSSQKNINNYQTIVIKQDHLNEQDQLNSSDNKVSNNFRQIRNSIITPHNNNTNINKLQNSNYLNQNQPQINYYHPQQSINPTHQQTRVSFNNSQSSSNLINLNTNQSSNQLIMRQNSLMNVGISNGNLGRSNSVQYSSLSQSPAPVVRFGDSLNKANNIVIIGGNNNNNGLGNNGSAMRVIPNNNSLVNPLIQRRSTVNFVSNNYNNNQYQHRILSEQQSIIQPLLETQNNKTFNKANSQAHNIIAQPQTILQPQYKKRQTLSEQRTTVNQQNKSSTSQTININDKLIKSPSNRQTSPSKRQTSPSKRQAQISHQQIRLIKQSSNSSNQHLPLTLPQQQPIQQQHQHQHQQTDLVQHLLTDQDEQQPIPITVSLTKQQKQQKQHQQQQKLQTDQNEYFDPQTQQRGNNLLVLTSYNQQEPNQQMMQISVNHCPTPDSSFIQNDFNEDLSDIAYDQKQDQYNNEYNQNRDGEFHKYNMETGKFIFDHNNNQKEVGNIDQDDNFYYQNVRQQMKKKNSSSSNKLIINGSAQQTNHIHNHNNISHSNNGNNNNNSNNNYNNNSNNNQKSNNSSQGMYKFQLKDTVNLFSINSLDSQSSHPYRVHHNSNDSLQNNNYVQSNEYVQNNLSKRTKLTKHQSNPSQVKKSLQHSQANTIINKLNKWDPNHRLQFDHNHRFQYDHNRLQSDHNRLQLSQPVRPNLIKKFNQPSSNFNQSLKNNKQTHNTKVQKLFKKHLPSHHQGYTQSTYHHLRQQLVGNENNHIGMTKDQQSSNLLMNHNNDDYKPKPQNSYMNSSQFSKYFNSINPQSTKNDKTNHFTTSPIIDKNITYKQLRNLLNSSSIKQQQSNQHHIN